MVENYKDVTEEENKFFSKIFKLDPMFFQKGYSKEEMNKILKENGIIEEEDGRW